MCSLWDGPHRNYGIWLVAFKGVMDASERLIIVESLLLIRAHVPVHPNLDEARKTFH